MSWICVCTIWYMYKRCASGLVDKSRDDEEFAEFVRQKFTRTASQHSCETTPARKTCRVDIHSSEKDYPPENFDSIPTFEQLMHASPIQQEAESLSIMDEQEVGNSQNSTCVRKSAKPKMKARCDNYKIVESLWRTGCRLPAKFSTPTKLGCSKCRYASVGCRRCREKNKLKLSFKIFDADGRVELVWTKCK